MAYVTMFLIGAGFIATGRWPALGQAYSEFCMGLLAAASIYSGSNTVAKVMMSKQPVVATTKTTSVRTKVKTEVESEDGPPLEGGSEQS